MTSFLSEETITAPYGSDVPVACKASGIPRPTVMLLINALTVYTTAGGHTVMTPYEATMTYTVKMSSDVECHIANRVGSSFYRMKIKLKGTSTSSQLSQDAICIISAVLSIVTGCRTSTPI